MSVQLSSSVTPEGSEWTPPGWQYHVRLASDTSRSSSHHSDLPPPHQVSSTPPIGSWTYFASKVWNLVCCPIIPRAVGSQLVANPFEDHPVEERWYDGMEGAEERARGPSGGFRLSSCAASIVSLKQLLRPRQPGTRTTNSTASRSSPRRPRSNTQDPPSSSHLSPWDSSTR